VKKKTKTKVQNSLCLQAQHMWATCCETHMRRSLPVVTGILIWYLCMSIICGCTERWEERSAGWKRWRVSALFFFDFRYSYISAPFFLSFLFFVSLIINQPYQRLFARLFFFTQGYFVHMYGQESGEKRWAGTLEVRAFFLLLRSSSFCAFLLSLLPLYLCPPPTK
jgi:hypothetical protein